jgi:hypothetical protein
MEHISKLNEIGANRRCLIIGGGHSVNSFNCSQIPSDITIIGTNNHHDDIADIIVFYDVEMQKYFTKHLVMAEYLIGFYNKKKRPDSNEYSILDHTTPECTHYYDYQDMIFGDTGFHCLQFADKVFNFSEIYLIGFDYKTKGSSYHYDEATSDERKLKKFETWSINNVLPKYKEIKWKNTVYNCSNDSNLSIFPYKELT